MNTDRFDEIMAYLASKPEAQWEYPFKPDVPVFKVCGKMFALVFIRDEIMCINLKCDPDHALELRSVFDAVLPGYHMNKKHWNTIVLDGTLPMGELIRLIDHSYALIIKGLTKAQREKLELRHRSCDLYGG